MVKRVRSVGNCEECGTYFESSAKAGRFCSNSCGSKFQGREEASAKIEQWKLGKITGNTGTSYLKLAPWLRRYLLDKYDHKCNRCGWDTPHAESGVPPLQIHHIDGDMLNNKEENLEVLCPNCHALTENYGARNKKSSNNLKSIRGYRSKEYLTNKGRIAEVC